MKTDEIRRRLKALEQVSSIDGCCCLVRLPDGSEEEVSVSEWLDNRSQWEWIKLTRRSGLLSPSYFIFLDLTESAIAGADPDDPQLISLTAERDYYFQILEEGGRLCDQTKRKPSLLC